MSCPDINRLIDFVGEVEPDAEIESHVLGCHSCEADIQLLQGLKAELRSEVEVPDRLVQRVMADLDLPETPPEKSRPPVFQVIGTGVLGLVTAMGALVVTGSVGAGDPTDLFMFSILAGIIAGLVQIRAGRKPALGET